MFEKLPARFYDVRHLVWHAESEGLFEVHGRLALQQCLSEGCDQVTGMQLYEKRFTELKEKKMGTPIQRKVRVPSKADLDAAQLMEQPLHIKYRPKHLADVIGHDLVVNSIQAMLKKPTLPHSFLFTGASGLGKTTFARILADKFGCEAANIIEVDAATNTGIDDMRALTETLNYQGFGSTPNKLFILDECHALSKAAWGSLLKAAEEPPPHVYFVFCTTEESKVPATIVTRCQTFNLKPLRYDDLMDLLEYVLVHENLGTHPDVVKLVARTCQGSPRQALTMLANVATCQDVNEAAALLEAPMESKEIIDLCRALVDKSLDWKKAQTAIKNMSEQSPESVRIVLVNYLNACLLNAKSEREVPRLLDLLASFSKPCNASDKWAPILLAIGNFIFPVV
jgi:DNA polymerase-3 subunit gamma/tau